MNQSYIAELTHKYDGIENTQNFVLLNVPATITGKAVLCALMLCIWDNENDINQRLSELDDDSDIGYEVNKLVNDFNGGHAVVYDRNDDVYSVDKIEHLTVEEAKAFDLLSPRLSTPCYGFHIFETMFNFAKTVELNNGEESFDELEQKNPLIFKLLNFYVEKLDQGAETFDAAWLEELNSQLK